MAITHAARAAAPPHAPTNNHPSSRGRTFPHTQRGPPRKKLVRTRRARLGWKTLPRGARRKDWAASFHHLSRSFAASRTPKPRGAALTEVLHDVNDLHGAGSHPTQGARGIVKSHRSYSDGGAEQTSSRPDHKVEVCRCWLARISSAARR